MRIGDVISRAQPGFLLQLPLDAAGEVEDIARDVIGIGRAGGEIDAPGVRRMGRHLAEHKGTVGGAQRTHAEAVEDAAVRKAPVAPGQQAGEVGFEIAGGQPAIRKVRIAGKQHAAVPDFRPLAPSLREMRVDLGAPSLRERPRPGFHLQIERRDVVDDRIAWRVTLHSTPSSSWPGRQICW